MRIILLAILLLSSLTSISQVWINEIHYDNTGTDTGEGVEIAGIAGTDLSCYDIIPYNGSGGVIYSPIGNPSGVLANSNCGFGAVFIPISGLQNGAPDGFALVNTCSVVVIQFLSYEGTITATNGPAIGMTSENIGVSQNGAPSGTSIQLAGIGNQYTDFTWEADITSTYNGMNTNQNFCLSTNTITTTAVATSPFALTCNTSATGNIDFTTTGTFNLGNIFTAELSDAAGSFSSPTAIGTLTGASAEGLNPGGTIPFTIPLGTVPGSLYRIRVVSDDPLTIGSDNGIDLTITNNCTITTGTTSSSSFSVSCASGTSGSIDFTSSSTMLAGNIYTAELSNSAGSFAAPVSIGTLSSTANTGTINITIPAATATGAGYLIRITASDPATIGTSTAPFTINLTGGPCTLTAPYMTSLIYDGCNSACSGGSTEGRSEIIFGNTGGYSVLVNPTNVNFIYNTNGNQPLTSGIVNNTTATANLNTEAGCSGLFLDGFGQTLSPNTSFLVVSQNLCISSLIWSDLCGSGPIYVLYASASGATWNDGGNFGNSSGTRNLQTIITSSDGSVHDISYSYTSVNGGDGSYATWSSDGGIPSTSGIFSNCRLSPVALPSGISLFKAVSDRTNALLYWQTNSEQNNDYFTIAHSTSGYDFEVLGQVQGAGNSSTLSDYDLIHSRPAQGINYYKLTSTDFDGTTYTKGIVSLLFNTNGCYFDAQTSEIKFNERSDYRVFSMDGKLLGEVMNESSMLFNQQGIVLIQDLRTGLTERLFVP